ncbi:hypothetical protein CKM354_000109600 [Cercospora kikuchii]|uniref:Heterokaryon incompatibility domain-containing protein n=1 Tax=Cercospora kikuchii TaxID=84275 RepID=A0A9P3C773_9PEZI|nr:uncharacterized protein CKM354_000109600 [Cercospora kikuchii]GIZ37654.1 hypothetical protein CKM354_000109600 [Cercospora kikuchii]
MWLLNTQSEKLEEWNEHDEELQYATLSHTWLRRSEGEGQEVLFANMADLATARQKAGWNKLDFAMKRAASDELRYVWIDTCCIDKESSAELAEAINSMFRIYQKSKYCYVYLDGHMQDETQSAAAHSDIDVSSAPIVCSANISAIPHQEEHSSEHGILMDEHNPPLNSADLPYSSEPGSGSSSRGNESGLRSGVSNAIFFCVAPAPICNITALFQKCRWFTRGWTLQEMVAAPNVLFYDASGKYIGTLAELVEKVSIITGVHREMLSRRRPLSSFSIAQRMAWASTRQTTRVEDRAYSMLGIFDVNLPILYGEGVRAFQRLQEELLRVYNDHTIFVWGYASPGFDVGNRCDLLASSPDEFNHDQYTKITAVTGTSDQKQYEVLGRTIRFHLPVLHMSKKDRFQAGVRYTAVLDCCFEDNAMRRICMELECAVSEISFACAA